MSQIQVKNPGLSLRKLCKFLSWRRQTVYARRYYKPQQAKEVSDGALVDLYKSVRKEYIAWGFVMIYAYLRNKGNIFCKKRGHRLYKQAQLSLHRKPQKARIRREFRDLLPPNSINEGWAMDFLSEVIIEPTQQWVRIINIVDECSRKDLWVEACEHIKATKLTEILDKLVFIRGRPAYIRTDNGPEFISDELAKWATKNKIELRFIQPGKPTQNGIIERLNGTLRRECLNLNWFYSLSELNQHLDKWYYAYNFERPHKSINYLTPNAFEKQNQSIYYKMVAPENR